MSSDTTFPSHRQRAQAGRDALRRGAAPIPHALSAALGLPESATFHQLRTMSALELIDRLLKARAANVGDLVTRIQQQCKTGPSIFAKPDTGLFRAYHDSLFTPVHPLLCASAIAASLVDGEDYSGFLQCFVSGDDVPEMKRNLYILFKGDDHNYVDHSRLSFVLEAEARVVEAFIQLGLQY